MAGRQLHLIIDNFRNEQRFRLCMLVRVPQKIAHGVPRNLPLRIGALNDIMGSLCDLFDTSLKVHGYVSTFTGVPVITDTQIYDSEGAFGYIAGCTFMLVEVSTMVTRCNAAVGSVLSWKESLAPGEQGELLGKEFTDALEEFEKMKDELEEIGEKINVARNNTGN